jgi:hypothetical protein
MDKDWDDLTTAEREAAKVLAYSKKAWDGDEDTRVTEKTWGDLSQAQRDAAGTLGYTRAIWDEVEDSPQQQLPRKGEKKPRAVDGGSRGGSKAMPYPRVEVSFPEPPGCGGVKNALERAWRAHEMCDAAAYFALFSDPDAVRACSRSYGLYYGRAITDPLADEWLELERTPPPASMLAEAVCLRISTVIPLGPGVVLAAYAVDASGGVRWEFEDEAAALDVLVQVADGDWAVAVHFCQWGIDSDCQKAGEVPFRYSWVTPVRSLATAMAFYEPIIGTPTNVDHGLQRASYSLRGGGFVLAQAGAPGCPMQAAPRPGLPNGFAELSVPDPAGYAADLCQRGVVRAGPVGEFFDSDGNLFVVDQAAGNSRWGDAGAQAGGPPIAAIEGLAWGGGPQSDVVMTWLSAWLAKDAATCERLLGAKGVFLDAAASQKTRLCVGARDASHALRAVFACYPLSHQLHLRVSQLYLKSLPGGACAASFVREAFSPAFSESASCLVVVAADLSVSSAVAVQQRRRTGQVLELDYCCVPVRKRDVAKAFYKDKCCLGNPYSDEGWYGWWSSGAVYGVFEASPQEDGLPVHGHANGYASLWVKSASDVANLVRTRGGGFPHIPAINDKPGVDQHPGYVQACCTDLDGNVFLATEYTGRRN